MPSDNQIAHVAVLSDTHGGHKLGLCPDGLTITEIDRQGNTYQMDVALNDVQQYLEILHSQALEYAKSLKGDLIVIHLGEQTQGQRRTEQLLASSLVAQIEIGFANLRRWAELPNVTMIRAAFGTGWHDFEEGSGTAIICNRIRDKYGLDIQAVYHGLLDVHGRLIDYQHHGPPPGSRNWLHGNVARYHLRSRMLDDIVAGNRPPGLYLYGHYHTPVDEVLTVGDHESRLIVMPSMCGMSDYAVRSTRSAWSLTNGIAFFQVTPDGISRPHWIKETLDIRTKESYERPRKSKGKRSRSTS